MNEVKDPRGARLIAIVPSQTAVGAPFTMTVVATLPTGRVDWHYAGTLRISTTDAKATGVGEAHAIPVAGGAFKHTMRLTSPGTHRITVVDGERNWTAVSNPIRVQEEEPRLSLYWGDLHVHAGERYRHREISDAYASIDYNYHFGRHVAAMDFMALSDHDQLGGWREGIVPIWDRFKAASAYHNLPGRFVTFLGWEWTNGVNLAAGRPQYGQKCVYFRGDNGPIYPCTDMASDTPEKLYDRLRGHECFIIPHHVAAPLNFYNDWNHHDPALERLVEIHSVWGCGERPASLGNPYPICPSRGGDVAGHHVRDALERGYTLGFTGGSDSHDGAPGFGYLHCGLTGAFERKRWGAGHDGELHHPGLQGVWADELTRESLFEAIYQRRTYATTGARIIVRSELAGKPMGHVFPVRPKLPWKLSADITGTCTIGKVEVIRNGETIHEVHPDSDHTTIAHELTPTPDRSHVYLRVTQTDGHMAWSSPHYLPAEATKTSAG